MRKESKSWHTRISHLLYSCSRPGICHNCLEMSRRHFDYIIALLEQTPGSPTLTFEKLYVMFTRVKKACKFWCYHFLQHSTKQRYIAYVQKFWQQNGEWILINQKIKINDITSLMSYLIVLFYGSMMVLHWISLTVSSKGWRSDNNLIHLTFQNFSFLW